MNHQLTIKCSPPCMDKKSFSSLKIGWSFFLLSVTIVTLGNQVGLFDFSSICFIFYSCYWFFKGGDLEALRGN